MPTYGERELIVPALRAILREPGISTSRLIDVLTEELEPTGRDADTIDGRNDTFFSQKVRNLKSHNTLEKHAWATYEDGNWYITDVGRKYLVGDDEIAVGLEYQGFSSEDISHELDDIVIEEGAETTRSVTVRRRSQRLRDEAIRRFMETHDGRLYCTACQFDFEQAYGERGEGFIEMHHTQPLREADVQGELLSQLLEDEIIVPLCSNCHCMIHRYPNDAVTVEELRQMRNS